MSAAPAIRMQGGPPGGGGAQPFRLPEIREDLKLLPGPRHIDGSPSWRIVDPVRNQFFEIGWLEFELLSRWTPRGDAAALLAAVSAETPLDPSEDELKELIEFLTLNQLLAATDPEVRKQLRKRWADSRQAWYTSLLHHYLFFRLPLVRPDAFLRATQPYVEFFFTRTFAWIVFGVFLVDLYLLSREWKIFAETLAEFFNIYGLFYYALAATFSKVVHELAHAYAAKRYGVRVPSMGVSFLVLWPFLYTDVAETWKLADRRKQLVIASAGMASELMLAVFATLLWSLSPEGTLKNVFFVLATTTWVMTLVINASPFMRFDGYFVLSDALDFPNLHERGAACAKWWMRRTFFGLDDRLPEPHLKPRNLRWLIVFAIVTWLYRLTVFLGIALLVYHFTVKLLGIFLMMVELVWFIAKPIWRETAYLWSRRAQVRIAPKPLLALLALLAVLLWGIPVANEVSAPGLLRAEDEQAIYPPMTARVRELMVKSGDRVEAGAVLARLEAPELAARWIQADVAINSALSELQRSSASQRQQEQRAVLQERLAQAVAEQQAVREEAARLEVRAAFSGVVRDMPADLVAGRWVNTRQLLMRVVSPGTGLIEVWLSESQIGAVERGQPVTFYPATGGLPVIRGTVISVDKTPTKEITRPMLASVHGGSLGAVTDRKTGRLVAFESAFRVLVRPEEGAPVIENVAAGNARIGTDLRLVAQNFLFRAISILIRESGF